VRNVVDERPTRDLHGRLSWTRTFVRREDCAGRDLLDVGCGFGWFELVALDQGVRSIVGIEPSEADLATARKHVVDERVAFRVGQALELPFADESFDTVVCWEVLEHLPPDTEQRAFDEFRRVLRPGGALYLSTPHAAPLPTLLDPARWLVAHRHYSRDQVEGFARAAGLEVDQLVLRGRGWEIAHMLNLYVAKWIFRRRPFLEPRFRRRLDREWARHGFTTVFVRCLRAATA
jgi:SAM-dependent methyltransferase